MNEGKYQFKQSKLYQGINYLMLFNIVLILLVSGIMAALNYRFVSKWMDGAQYLSYGEDSLTGQVASVYFSFYLLMNQFVPLELLIILEMV